MGTIEVRNQENAKDRLSSFSKLDLKINTEKKVIPQLQQLCHWSFEQIKETYSRYQRKSQCPFIDWFMMKKILPFERPSSKTIFEYFAESDKYVSIYELICVLVLLSYHTYRRKMQFLHMIFDFQHRKQITIKHLILIYESMVNGFCRVTGQKLPQYSLLEKYTRSYFLKGNPSQIYKTAKIRSLIQQIEGSPIVSDLFGRFEHSEFLDFKEQYTLYSQQTLKKYNSDEVEKIFRIIYKAYKDKNFQQVQIVQYNKQLRLGNRRNADFQKNYDYTQNYQKQKSLNRGRSTLNIRANATKVQKSNSYAKLTPGNSPVKSKITQRQTSFPKLQAFNTLQTKYNDSTPFKSKLLTSKNPESTAQKLTKLDSDGWDDGWDSSPTKKVKKAKFLFLNHQTLSKRDMFQTINYFRTLSGNEQDIRVKQFFKSFQKKSFMKKQLTALFRVIDTNKNGQISFQQFLKALYPLISDSEIKVVLKWKQEYFRTYYADSIQQNQLKINHNQSFNMLPKDSLNRIRQIFDTIDSGKKGFISYSDIVQSFKTGYSLGDCQNLVKEYGDTKGHIYFEAFVKMILPKGWIIEGYNPTNNYAISNALTLLIQ